MASIVIKDQTKSEINMNNNVGDQRNNHFTNPKPSASICQFYKDKRIPTPKTPTTPLKLNKKPDALVGLYGSNRNTVKTPSTAKIPEYLQTVAQEPWPKDVKLYQPYEVEQILLPDNANCLATQAFLKMCGLDFQIEQRKNAEFMSPTGKVPFIRAGAFVISEFDGIVQFVNSKGISLTSQLEPDQKSDMRAYMSLVHNVLENAELYICWCDPETYREVTKPRNGSVYPWPLNHIQNWSKRNQCVKKLKIFGWYSKTLSDVYQEVENCCQALTDRLENKEYFFGNRFTEFDALIYGHVKALVTRRLSRDMRAGTIVAKFDNLLEHCRRIDSLLFKRVTDFSAVITTKEIKRNIIEKTKSMVFSTNGSTTSLIETELLTVTEVENAGGDSTNAAVCVDSTGQITIEMDVKG